MMRAIVLAAWLIATPALAEVTAAPRSADAGDQLPLSVWKLTPDGPEHLQTGLRCPPMLGDYRRYGVTTYDAFGLDVSCGWNSEVAVVTVYLTRTNDLPAAYADAKQQLTTYNEGRRPVFVAETKVRRGGLDWLKAEYTEDPGLRSDIWMADLHGWILEYRTTYRPAEAQSVSAQIAELTNLVQATAGTRLGLCAKSGPPSRPGKEVRDKDAANGLMTALIGSIGVAAAQEQEVPAEPVVFCVEDPVRGKSGNFLIWRGVDSQGADARIDRLTPMTMNPPPVLESRLDEMASLITSELAPGEAAEQWVATVQDGDRTVIFANYKRRPSAKLLASLMQLILDGKARALGSYSIDGKDVSVTVPK